MRYVAADPGVHRLCHCRRVPCNIVKCSSDSTMSARDIKPLLDENRLAQGAARPEMVGRLKTRIPVSGSLTPFFALGWGADRDELSQLSKIA